MIHYASLEVSLHGLNAKNTQEVKERVEKAIRAEFDVQMESDLEVHVTEHAGVDAQS